LRLKKFLTFIGSCNFFGKIKNDFYFLFVVASAKWLGMVSLVVLTVQNATLGISMSYARRREGDMFLSSSGLLATSQNNHAEN
jgi:hypothetical protein